MAGLPRWSRDDLSGDAALLFDRVVARGAHADERGQLSGPYNAWLRTPEIGLGVLGLSQAMASVSLSADVRELVVLVVAPRWNASYEWQVHAQKAAECGVASSTIDAISRGEEPPDATTDQRHAWLIASTLMNTGSIAAPELDGARQALGERKTVEVATVCGFYTLIAFALDLSGPPPVDDSQPAEASESERA